MRIDTFHTHRSQSRTEIGKIDTGNKHNNKCDGNQNQYRLTASLRNHVIKNIRYIMKLRQRSQPQIQVIGRPRHIFPYLVLFIIIQKVVCQILCGFGAIQTDISIIIRTSPVIQALLIIQFHIDSILEDTVYRKILIDTSHCIIHLRYGKKAGQPPSGIFRFHSPADSRFRTEYLFSLTFRNQDLFRVLQGILRSFQHIKSKHIGKGRINSHIRFHITILFPVLIYNKNRLTIDRIANGSGNDMR